MQQSDSRSTQVKDSANTQHSIVYTQVQLPLQQPQGAPTPFKNTLTHTPSKRIPTHARLVLATRHGSALAAESTATAAATAGTAANMSFTVRCFLPPAAAGFAAFGSGDAFLRLRPAGPSPAAEAGPAAPAAPAAPPLGASPAAAATATAVSVWSTGCCTAAASAAAG